MAKVKLNDAVMSVTLPKQLRDDALAKCQASNVSLSHIVRESLKLWLDGGISYGLTVTSDTA